jgi:hypothetical protein
MSHMTLPDGPEPDVYRVARRLAGLARRVPQPAWPFVLLAAAQLGVLVIDGMSADPTYLLLVATVLAWTLVPAAVIIGRPNAWRSARGILVGAIAWTTLEAVGLLLGRVSVATGWDPFLTSPAIRIFGLVRLLAGLAGPAVIAIYLERRRRTTTRWPAPLVAPAVLAVAALCVYSGSQALNQYQPWYPYLDTSNDLARQIQIVGTALGPVMLLTLGALAWSSWSAFRAGERPRRFWAALAAGSAALMVAQVVNNGLILAVYASWMAVIVGGLLTTADNVELLASAAGTGLLLAAFALGIPDDPADVGDVVGVPAPVVALPDGSEPG